jgi:hypothetical protein
VAWANSTKTASFCLYVLHKLGKTASLCVLGATFFGRRHAFFALGGFYNLSYDKATRAAAACSAI